MLNHFLPTFILFTINQFLIYPNMTSFSWYWIQYKLIYIFRAADIIALKYFARNTVAKKTTSVICVHISKQEYSPGNCISSNDICIDSGSFVENERKPTRKKNFHCRKAGFSRGKWGVKANKGILKILVCKWKKKCWMGGKLQENREHILGNYESKGQVDYTGII